MLLAIETATNACSVALIDGGNVVASYHDVVGRGHAERLIPMIADLPGSGRAESIIVGCGPGSFTGVRVGLAAARGLGLAWNVPVRGCPTLALIAARACADWPDLVDVSVAIEGGHGQIFVQNFATYPLRATADLVSLPLEDAVEAAVSKVVIGSASGRLVEARGAGTAIEGHPNAADIILVPEALMLNTLQPIYGRAADAKPQVL